MGVNPKIGVGTPKSSILIGFSLIFTIHFGGPPLFLETPIFSWNSKEPVFLWLFQLDDSKSLHTKWLEITISIHPFKTGCLDFQVCVMSDYAK